MAEAAVIGALRVVLGADSAQLEDGFKRAQKSADSFGKDLALAAAAIGAAVAGMATALGFSVKSSIDAMDAMTKQAQKIGIPVQELSALRLAAELSDVSMETLGKSVGKLSKTMVESAAKPTSEAANAFRALGISVTSSDGSLKSSSQVMEEVSDRFAGLKDGAGKTAVAMALFGRGGAELIPMLNAGGSGLREMKEEAAKLGIVFTADTGRAAEAFNDNLRRLSLAKQGVVMQLTAHMLPALQTLSERMVQGVHESNFVARASSALITIFNGFARGVMLVVDNFGLLVRVTAAWVGLSVTMAVASAALAFVKFAAAVNLATLAKTLFVAVSRVSVRGLMLIGAILAATTANFDSFKSVLEGLWNSVKSLLPEGAMEGVADQLKGLGINIDALSRELTVFTPAATAASTAQRDFNFAAMAGKNAVDQLIDSTRKSIASQQAELQTIGMADGAKERLRLRLQALSTAQGANITMTAAQKARLEELGRQVEDMTLKIKGAQLVQEAREPHEKFRDELTKNEAALKAFGATAEKIAAVQQNTAEKYGATWAQVSSNAAGSFAQLADSFGKENRSMAVAGKALAIFQATINAYMASSKALASLPPPMSYVAAAAALAQGLATVMNIKSQSLPAMKTGGAMTVPGGRGGGDRVRAMVDLEPGEQLDVWRPGDPGGDPRRGAMGGSYREIVIRVEGETFGQKTIRKLVEGINEAIGDGVRLRTA